MYLKSVISMNSETRKSLTVKFRIDDLRPRLLQHEQTRFNESDWCLFFDSLDVPVDPTERMKKAAKRYNQIVNPEGA